MEELSVGEAVLTPEGGDSVGETFSSEGLRPARGEIVVMSSSELSYLCILLFLPPLPSSSFSCPPLPYPSQFFSLSPHLPFLGFGQSQHPLRA